MISFGGISRIPQTTEGIVHVSSVSRLFTMIPLPDPEVSRRLLQSVAMLDALVSEFSGDRYYFFKHLSEGNGYGRMDNGSGDHFHAFFSGNDAVIQGFNHESHLSPFDLDPPRPFPGVIDELPFEFATALLERGVNIGVTTFCYWRSSADAVWKHGNTDFAQDSEASGARELLKILDGRPETYAEFAEYYYERPIDIESVDRFYRFEPMNRELAKSLSAEINWVEAVHEAGNVGYPIAKSGN